MLSGTKDWARLVEPDRVHRDAYISQEVFDAEIENIWEKTWIYAGHESQVKQPGDYYVFQLGRQPMVMVRETGGKVNVLYNRCPHRGAMLCSDISGNTGKTFKCPYHAWRFNLDGSLLKIPIIEGYDNTRFDPKDPQFQMTPAPRVESYRGFVFASLSEDGPDLKTFLGGARIAFDDMCDRAPDGEVEVASDCFRVIQTSNWKIFLENQLDAVHPSITHEAAGRAALEIEKEIKARTGKNAPLDYHYVSAFTAPFYKFDAMDTVGFVNGHTLLRGYMDLRRQDPEMIEYEKLMKAKYGEKRMEEILSVDIHHVLVYPELSVQPPLQQMRVLRPLGPGRTLSEIWLFRLKGANEGMFRRALGYYQLVNSPSTMINADDLDNWWRIQNGLVAKGNDWLSLHRNAGQDLQKDGNSVSVTGMSEHPMRHMFGAWLKYMGGENAR